MKKILLPIAILIYTFSFSQQNDKIRSLERRVVESKTNYHVLFKDITDEARTLKGLYKVRTLFEKSCTITLLSLNKNIGGDMFTSYDCVFANKYKRRDRIYLNIQNYLEFSNYRHKTIELNGLYIIVYKEKSTGYVMLRDEKFRHYQGVYQPFVDNHDLGDKIHIGTTLVNIK